MENLTLLHKGIQDVEEVLPAMAVALNLVEQWLRRHDQEKELGKVMEHVSNRVKRELSQEYVAYQIYLREKIQDNLGGLVADVVNGLLGGRMQPQPDGSAETPCFTRVLVAVGPEGIPGDLRVVNVSHLVRNLDVSDSAVEKTLRSQGLSLFTLQRFEKLAAWLGREVLDGRIRLPYHPSETSNAIGR